MCLIDILMEITVACIYVTFFNVFAYTKIHVSFKMVCVCAHCVPSPFFRHSMSLTMRRENPVTPDLSKLRVKRDVSCQCVCECVCVCMCVCVCVCVCV